MQDTPLVWEAALEDAAKQRLAHRGVRQRRVLASQPDMRVTDGQCSWVNFSGNDYLGLAGEPDLAGALAAGANAYGVGSGASSLVTGYGPAHRRLEIELADFLEREAVLLCSSGFLANLAVATSLAGRGERIVQDRLCHASLIDAARLSGARLVRYPHADVTAMRQRLEAQHPGRCLLVSDGVFSMDGDVAPLPALVDAATHTGALLVVDDAHGIGVLGPGGRGSTFAAGLGAGQVPVLVGTLGKAFGCFGAFIAGGRNLVEHLVNEARSYIFTTALPPALAEAARVALVCVRKDEWRRERLHGLIEQFREGATQRGIPLSESVTPIQPLRVGDPGKALDLSSRLQDQGMLVTAIRPPSVPRGTSRLRITLSAGHRPEQVSRLLDALEQCLAGR